MKFKSGVSQLGVSSEILLALMVANDVYKDHGTDMVCTSITDGMHSVGSRHYSGLACDLRIRNLPDGAAPEVKDQIAENLGEHYDVILESTHIHIEYDPAHS